MDEDTTNLFDKLQRDEVGVWDVIRVIETDPDALDLERALISHPHLASNILYIISELSSRRRTAVWRIVIPYLNSSSLSEAYYALDVVQSLVGRVGDQEILDALSNMRSDDDELREKSERIRAAARSNLHKQSKS